jgi:hypothetical protein
MGVWIMRDHDWLLLSFVLLLSMGLCAPETATGAADPDTEHSEPSEEFIEGNPTPEVKSIPVSALGASSELLDLYAIDPSLRLQERDIRQTDHGHQLIIYEVERRIFTWDRTDHILTGLLDLTEEPPGTLEQAEALKPDVVAQVRKMIPSLKAIYAPEADDVAVDGEDVVLVHQANGYSDWYLNFHWTYKGIPASGAVTLGFSGRSGKLKDLTVRPFCPPASVEPIIDREKALKFASWFHAEWTAGISEPLDCSLDLTFPQIGKDEVPAATKRCSREYILCWTVVFPDNPAGVIVVQVDAKTGDVIRPVH